MNNRVPMHRRRMSKVAKSITPSEAIKAVKEKADLQDKANKARSDFSAKVDALEKRVRGSGKSESEIAAEIDKGIAGLDSKKVNSADRAVALRDKKINTQRELASNPEYAQYAGLTKDQAQEAIKKRGGSLTGEQLAKIHGSKLTFGQNMKALGHELKGQRYTPSAVLKRGYENMGEGGGGWKGGTQWGRYNTLGAKGMTGLFAAGDLKDAANKTDTTGQGRSRTERLGYAAGGLLGSVAGTIGAKRVARFGGLAGTAVAMGAGIGGMMGGYMLGGKAGKMVDKGVSKLRGVEAGDYKQELLARAQRAYDKNRKNRGY